MNRIIKESLIHILNERMNDIRKRIDQIDEQARQLSEFSDWYNYLNKYQMPSPEDGNQFGVIPDIHEYYHDAYKGLMEEREQLCKLYQETIKRLNEVHLEN